MDNFESNPLENNKQNQDSIDTQSHPISDPRPVQEPYHGAGSGRKESPFADSPYATSGTYQSEDNTWKQTQYKAGYTIPPVEQEKKKKGSGKGWKIAVAIVVSAGLLGGSIAGTAAVVNNSWEEKAQQMEEAFEAELTQLRSEIENINVTGGNFVSGSPVSTDGLIPSQVYNQNVKSVVAISNQTTTNYFGQVSETASTGSGFILTEDGYVVTNYHVVEGATTLSVITYDGTEYPAELVGYEENNDLAVLKIEAADLPAVSIGSSDDLIIGDMVVAIGNPLGELTSTMTVGYLSAKDRDVTTDGSKTINMMQTDAAINPGNSGGPLFNMKGEVVGITTAKYSGTTTSGASIEGIGFAIPIDDVIGMVTDLMDYGYITGAYLGVGVIDMDEQTASIYSLPLGAYVREVTEGSCAEKAGVMVKDIIIGLGDYTVDNYTDLSRALRKFEAGDTTTIRVYRGGQELELTVTLDEKPQETAATAEPTTEPLDENQMPENGSFEEWYEFFSPFFGN